MIRTKIWAHRGASAYAPENTLEAFELAEKQGADGVELDVQLTKDGQIVVIHDETIDRVSDGTGYVKDYTLSQLKEFQFNRLHPEFHSVKIPTLEEVYQLVSQTSMTVNVELKTGILRYKGIEEKVVELTKKMEMENRVIYSSFHHPSLVKIKKLDKHCQTGLLYSDGWIDVCKYALHHGIDALHPAIYHMKSKKLINTSKEKQLPLHVWTVDEESYMSYLIKNQIEAIITNKPDIGIKTVLEDNL